MDLKKYEVFVQDEWNNLWLMGFYDTLSEALPDVNDFLESYGIRINDLSEYASTFGSCFDKEVETKDGEIIMVRGLIFNGESLEEIKQCLI